MECVFVWVLFCEPGVRLARDPAAWLYPAARNRALAVMNVSAIDPIADVQAVAYRGFLI